MYTFLAQSIGFVKYFFIAVTRLKIANHFLLSYTVELPALSLVRNILSRGRRPCVRSTHDQLKPLLPPSHRATIRYISYEL